MTYYKIKKQTEMNESILKQPPMPIAYLVHEPTMTSISVYKPINWFQRVMIKWFFGLKYEKA